jgi:hypothetical protein
MTVNRKSFNLQSEQQITSPYYIRNMLENMYAEVRNGFPKLIAHRMS